MSGNMGVIIVDKGILVNELCGLYIVNGLHSSTKVLNISKITQAHTHIFLPVSRAKSRTSKPW